MLMQIDWELHYFVTFDPFSICNKLLDIFPKIKEKIRIIQIYIIEHSLAKGKVEKSLKGSLDSIPSPSS